jgi:hypothetical protein
MRLRTITLFAIFAAACGGTSEQAEMPDPSVVDHSADDMGLPAPEPGSEPITEERSEPAPEPVRLVAGESSAIEGGNPTVRIQAPRNGQRIAAGPVMLRLAVRNWPLAPDPGAHVHVIVDNEPYIAVRDISQPLDLSALVQENLGHPLAEGSHVVRVFPSRAHHESAKTAGAFAVTTFHLVAASEGFQFDVRAPLLTYSRPKGCNPVGERVLLDFYVSNVELAADGHRVRAQIDGETVGEIGQWVPHWIEGLRAGEHEVRLTLIDAQGEPVAGPFNDTTRSITVAAQCP